MYSAEKDRWLVNKAKDQQMSELNDEVESLKEEKKRLKHQVEIENANSNRQRKVADEEPWARIATNKQQNSTILFLQTNLVVKDQTTFHHVAHNKPHHFKLDR